MRRSLPLLVVALVALAGCGEPKPKLVAVTGKVTMKGEPLTAGAIYFVPDGQNAYTKDNPSCLLGLDGTFTMRTFPFGDGVAPGKYKVTLAPELASRVKKPDYGNPAKTPWELVVPDAGVSNHTFEVK